MRRWLPVWIILHQLDGTPIWVEHSTIHIFKAHELGQHPMCPRNAGSSIKSGPTGLCLKETPKQICDKVEKYGGQCERE